MCAVRCGAEPESVVGAVPGVVPGPPRRDAAVAVVIAHCLRGLMSSNPAINLCRSLRTGPDAPNPPLRGGWVENAPRFRPRRDPRRVPRFGRGAECARMVLLASYLVLWESAKVAGCKTRITRSLPVESLNTQQSNTVIYM